MTSAPLRPTALVIQMGTGKSAFAINLRLTARAFLRCKSRHSCEPPIDVQLTLRTLSVRLPSTELDFDTTETQNDPL